MSEIRASKIISGRFCLIFYYDVFAAVMDYLHYNKCLNYSLIFPLFSIFFHIFIIIHLFII